MSKPFRVISNSSDIMTQSNMNIMSNSINIMNDYSNDKIIYDTIINPDINLAYCNPIIVTNFVKNNIKQELVPIIQNCRELDILYNILAENNISYFDIKLTYCVDKNILRIIEGYEKMGNLPRYIPVLTKKKLKYFSKHFRAELDLTIYNKESINGLPGKYLEMLLKIATSTPTISKQFKDNIFNGHKLLGEETFIFHVIDLLGTSILTSVNFENLGNFRLSNACLYDKIISSLCEKTREYFNEKSLQTSIGRNNNDSIRVIFNIVSYIEKILNERVLCSNEIGKILNNLNVVQDIELFWQLFLKIVDKKIKMNEKCLLELFNITISKISSDPEYLTSFVRNMNTFKPFLINNSYLSDII